MSENKYEEMMEKSEALAKSYAESIGSERKFGIDTFYMKAEKALCLGNITKDTYDKIMDLAKAVHVTWSFSDIPNVKVQDFKRLERILNGKPGEEPDSFMVEYIKPLEEKAEEYKRKIGTDSEFGSRQWKNDLSDAEASGKITETEFDVISRFADNNAWIIGQSENAKDIRWAALTAWLKELSMLYGTGGKKLTAETMDFFKELLEKDKVRLSKDRYAAIYMAFNDMKNMEQSAFYSVQDEMTLKEMEQNAKGLSVLIWMGIQIAVPLLFCLFIGLPHGFFLGGIAIWGLCTPVVLPLQLIGGGFLACALADAIALKGREPSDEYKAGEAAALGGLVVGGIHAGVSCGRELAKPGWTKDSKKV